MLEQRAITSRRESLWRRVLRGKGIGLSGSLMRHVMLVVLTVLSLGVGGYALAVYGFRPLGAAVHPDMRATFTAHGTGIYWHIFASAVALLLGPFQLSARLRRAWPAWHRWMGRLYLGVGVLIGGVAGFLVALSAYGGLTARAGFACLALAWLFTGFRAFRAIRGGDVPSHRRWMARNYALTFAAVTLRLWLPTAVALGAPFEVAYAVIAWLCWVPNLMVAELLLRPMRGVPPQGGRRTGEAA